MKSPARLLTLSALSTIALTACDPNRGQTPGPGARSENTNATDARSQDGSPVAGSGTPGNRGGTPGGAAPGASPGGASGAK